MRASHVSSSSLINGSNSYRKEQASPTSGPAVFALVLMSASPPGTHGSSRELLPRGSSGPTRCEPGDWQLEASARQLSVAPFPMKLRLTAARLDPKQQTRTSKLHSVPRRKHSSEEKRRSTGAASASNGAGCQPLHDGVPRRPIRAAGPSTSAFAYANAAWHRAKTM